MVSEEVEVDHATRINLLRRVPTLDNSSSTKAVIRGVVCLHLISLLLKMSICFHSYPLIKLRLIKTIRKIRFKPITTNKS